MTKNNISIRQEKIADLLAIINGELSPATVRSKKQLICIDWGEDIEEEGAQDWSVFLIDGKKVDRETFNKEVAWKEENKKLKTS